MILDKQKYLDDLRKIYGNDDIDYDKISLAYDFGKYAHRKQTRKSGEPYFIHPEAVSLILAELRMDTDSIVSGLLHDVVEDTEFSYDDIVERYGESIAKLVDGVTKLGKINFNTKEEFEAENLRKMFLAMAEDARVIIIKLADRLHNIRTLQHMTEEKQKQKARETLEIYAPIAERLGIFAIKQELEDTSLRYLHPTTYNRIVSLVDQKKGEREKNIEQVVGELREALKTYKPDAEIYGRAKSYYSIYRKMYVQNRNFNEMFDITAVRIVVDTIEECWGVLGIVHSLWTPIHGRLKDYISLPKQNMYRSLHTTVIGNFGKPFEIQIRTKEMHQMAEYGIAAHWKYKAGNKDDGVEETIDKKLDWIRHLIEDQQDYDSPKEFVDTLKFELVSSSVYVCTPEGKVIELPSGSTPVDFAYKIHSDVGNSCIGAKVDGRIVPLNYILENGKIVQILTSKTSNGPSRDWLKFVKSSMARNKIKRWFKKQNRDENIEKGRELLERELQKNNLPVNLLNRKELQSILMDKLSVKQFDDLYASIGYGGIMTNQVLPTIKQYNKTKNVPEVPEDSDIRDILEKSISKYVEPSSNEKGIIVEGIGSTVIKLAKCCNPVPGDSIVGFITRGRGVTVHQSECTNLENSESALARHINVRWANMEESSYNCSLQITAYDQPGLLSEVSLTFADLNASVNAVNARKDKNGVAIMKFDIGVSDKQHLEKIVNALRSMQGTLDVKRVNG